MKQVINSYDQGVKYLKLIGQLDCAFIFTKLFLLASSSLNLWLYSCRWPQVAEIIIREAKSLQIIEETIILSIHGF
jgi:hypothetical protein